MVICVNLVSKVRDILCTDVNERGIINYLCDAVTSKYGDNPLLLASEALTDTIRARGTDTVFISFGFATPPNYVQETDGITGAIFLARALKKIGTTVALVIDERQDIINVTREVLNVADLKPIFVREPYINTHCLRDLWIPVFTLRVRHALIKGDIIELLNNMPPSVILFVEKAGHNYLGVYHSMSGIDVSHYHSHVEELISLARSYDAITISIGDGGNEVGMGVIEDTVRRVVPYGNVCRCPCKGGIAASSTVDYLVTSVISNIGAYALELLLLRSFDRLNYAHTTVEEMLCLKTAVFNGAVDGVTGRSRLMVDGLSQDAYSEVFRRVLATILNYP